MANHGSGESSNTSSWLSDITHQFVDNLLEIMDDTTHTQMIHCIEFLSSMCSWMTHQLWTRLSPRGEWMSLLKPFIEFPITKLMKISNTFTSNMNQLVLKLPWCCNHAIMGYIQGQL